MKHNFGARVVALDIATRELRLLTTWHAGQAPKQHLVELTPTEAHAFDAVLQEHPFGALAEHSASIENLSDSGSSHTCGIRLSRSGSRALRTVPVCPSTYAALKRVLDTNIVSDGYVPE